MAITFQCLLFLLFAINAFMQANRRDPMFDDVIITPNYKNGTADVKVILRGWEGCDVEGPCNPGINKKEAIKKGFEDMQIMIPEDMGSDPSDPPENAYPINWENAAAVEFFGPFQRTGEHRQNVQSKLGVSNSKHAI